MNRRATLACTFLALALGAGDAGAATRRARGFALFAWDNLVLSANRVQCNINTIGEWCVDPTNSPVNGGGFWPRGTPDQYVFNGGPRVAAIVGGDGGPWAGDTVGAYFFDPRGNQAHGSAISRLYDSRATAADEWPGEALVADTALFHAALLGRQAASEQDSWVRYWDGNPNLTTGRPHAMGIVVDQRSLAWNYPVGNDDIVYQVFRLLNVTASDPAAYEGLGQYGYGAADIAKLAALGRIFHDRMRAAHEVDVPAAGYTFTRLYFDYGEDADVGNAGANLSNANLAFDLMAAYKSDFLEPAWSYPADVFFTPLAAAPGFAASLFLSTPNDTGIVLFTNTTGSATFTDRVGVAALWRQLSANIVPADGTCSVPLSSVPARRFCQVVQVNHDTRMFMSTGPVTLGPGQALTIVMAKVFAAPVESMTCSAGSGACPAGTWSLAPFINPATSAGRMAPGLPLSGSRLVQGLDTVRNYDRALGWIDGVDADADGKVEWHEVSTVPRSTLWKAQLARAMVANRFLTPQPPAAPRFFALPGDRKVSLVWEASATEAEGDPFFAAASNSATPLYDPDYRERDVEGYRVWRGTSAENMQVVAQFDYTGTSIADHTGQFTGPPYGNACAPELGVTTSCPAFPNPVPLAGRPVQVRPGDRVVLANGQVSVLHADTLPMLYDTGVPFVFTDSGLANGVSYYYAVTAFDANSVKSGPVSLESERVIKTVTPRVPASNPATAESYVVELIGDDGAVLDPAAPFPAINPNGTLAGPIPPANTSVVELLSYVPELLRAGDYLVRIDSVSPGCIGQAFCGEPRLHVSFMADTTFAASALLPQLTFSAAVTSHGDFALESRLVPIDTTRARELGLAGMGRVYSSVRLSGRTVTMAATSPTISTANGRYGAQGTNRAARFLGHSYWYMEGGTPPANPTITPFPSPSRNSGALAGVDTIYHPAAYWQPTTPTGAGGSAAYAVNPFYRYHDVAAGAAWYPGEFTVTWNADATLSVRDLTHHVDLPFRTTLTPGWGFIDLDTLVAYGITAGDLADGTGTPGMNALSYHHAYAIDAACQAWGIGCAPLSPMAVLQPLDFNADGTADGNGFVLVVNGEPFFMSLNTIPAAGTQWHLTAFGGGSIEATCNAGVPGTGDITMATAPATCNYASYTPPPYRPALAPGLTYRLRVTAARTFARADAGNLDAVHTVPDPYYLADALEAQTGRQAIRFVNIPERAIIRIYSTSGILVGMVTHNDATGGGEAEWDVRNRNGHPVASGVYFWHLVTADGRQKVGRFTVVNGRR